MLIKRSNKTILECVRIYCNICKSHSNRMDANVKSILGFKVSKQKHNLAILLLSEALSIFIKDKVKKL